jgi:hypothetical protein
MQCTQLTEVEWTYVMMVPTEDCTVFSYNTVVIFHDFTENNYQHSTVHILVLSIHKSIDRDVSCVKYIIPASCCS